MSPILPPNCPSATGLSQRLNTKPGQQLDVRHRSWCPGFASSTTHRIIVFLPVRLGCRVVLVCPRRAAKTPKTPPPNRPTGSVLISVQTVSAPTVRQQSVRRLSVRRLSVLGPTLRARADPQGSGRGGQCANSQCLSAQRFSGPGCSHKKMQKSVFSMVFSAGGSKAWSKVRRHCGSNQEGVIDKLDLYRCSWFIVMHKHTHHQNAHITRIGSAKRVASSTPNPVCCSSPASCSAVTHGEGIVGFVHHGAAESRALVFRRVSEVASSHLRPVFVNARTEPPLRNAK